MRAFEVAVVGAGPAGSSCALALARAGLTVVLVDRARFPRGKPCGGALGHAGASLLLSRGVLDQGEMEELTLRRHVTMSCFWRGRLLRSYASPGPPIRIVDRTRFDAFLVRKAREAGAEVVEGDGFAGLRAGCACLRSGTLIGFRRLVGADGAGSAVARAAGLRRGRNGFGLEFLLPSPDGLADGLQIHFGLEAYGYGWVFPRGADVCVGLGRCGGRARPRALAERLLDFTESLGLGRPDPSGLKAAAIPSGSPSLVTPRSDVYLAGDAAGLVDRVSGEGISLAVESGLLTAEAIASGWTAGELDRKASAGCLGRVRDSSLARHLLYFPVLRRMAVRKLASKDKFQEGYWRLVAGEGSYRDMLKGFLRTP